MISGATRRRVTEHQVRQAMAKLAPVSPPTHHQAADTTTCHPRPWPLALIGVAAAVAVWGGRVELGRYTGFGMVQPLPGLVDSLWINTAIVLPLSIEAYGSYALRVWLSSATLSQRARWSALASLMVGAGAQVASHLMRAATITSATWQVTVVVACVPVAVLGLATLVRQDTTSPPPQETHQHDHPGARNQPPPAAPTQERSGLVDAFRSPMTAPVSRINRRTKPLKVDAASGHNRVPIDARTRCAPHNTHVRPCAGRS
jgi:hypothetical protein